MNAAGEVLVPIDPAAVEMLGRRLVALGIEAVAVCFLHSYANPAHEAAAGDVLRRHFPRSVRDAEPRAAARIPRIRAHLDDGAQRLRRSAGVPLSRPFRRLRAGGALCRQDRDHALQRRHHVDRAGAARAGGDDGIGTGCRHDRRRPAGRSHGHRARDRLRHGRHHRQVHADQRRHRADRGGLCDRRRIHRPAHAIAGGRHRRGRRRRRLARLVRRAAAGCMSGR